jgi:hypothetical protein
MAIINKDFRLKNGLVVEGTNATVNGYDILTKNAASDTYILNLVGGVAYITSVSGNLNVTDNELTINETGLATNLAGSYLDANSGVINVDIEGIADDLISGANFATTSYISTALQDYTTTNNLDTTVGGYGYLKTGDLPTMYSDWDAVAAVKNALADGLTYDNNGPGGNYRILVDTNTIATRSYVGTALEDYTKTIDLPTMYTDEDAVDAIQAVLGNGIEYETGVFNVQVGTGLEINGSNQVAVDTTVIATKAYVDATAQGLDVKASVYIATTADSDIMNPDSVDNSYYIDASTTLGDIPNGSRILIKDIPSGPNRVKNGIYVLNTDTYTLTRPEDATFDSNTDEGTLTKGAFTFVESGANAGKGFVVTSAQFAGGINWAQFSETGNYITSVGSNLSVSGSGQLTVDISSKQDELTAGNGINISGATVSVKTGIIPMSGLDASSGNLVISRTVVDEWYDAAGAADTAEGNANDYTDTAISNLNLSTTYDAYGAASTAESNANSYTDTAIGNLTTADIEEYFPAGPLYFTDARAKSSALSLLTSASVSNITFADDGSGGLIVTAENGVDDSTTDDLTEGSLNKYASYENVHEHITNQTIHPVAVEISNYRKEEATQQSVSSASTVNVHTFGYPYESVKYLVRVVGWDGGVKHSQITEILMTVDGNDNVAMTEYGNVHTSTNPLASFSATFDAGSNLYSLTATTAVSGCEIIAAATMLSWAD